MFRQVTCSCEGRYYKINYKYEGYTHTKTKAGCKNILCSFICKIRITPECFGKLLVLVKDDITK